MQSIYIIKLYKIRVNIIIIRIQKMSMKRMSKTIVTKIQQNLRPLSTTLTSSQTLKSSPQLKKPLNQIPSNLNKIQIDEAYRIIKQNANIDSKTNIQIITCLKAANKNWQDYIANPNKNGQLACVYEIRLKRIEIKLEGILARLIVFGDPVKVRMVGEMLKPIIEYLQKKGRKYKEHESQFKIINRRSEQQEQQQEQKDEEIKQEMADLVSKFKKYAVNISENLSNDTVVIKQIGENQDKQLNSLQNKNTTMEQIIKQQRLGFFQLVTMGIFAIVAWIIGLMFIIIV